MTSADCFLKGSECKKGMCRCRHGYKTTGMGQCDKSKFKFIKIEFNLIKLVL